MSVYLISHHISAALGVVIVVFGLYGLLIKPDRRRLFPVVALVYGLAEVTFYVVTLLLRDGSLSYDLSPIRSLVKNALIATYIVIMVIEWQKTLTVKWKKS